MTVILIECTGDLELTVPCMITVLGARWSGSLFNHGIYDLHIKLRQLPFLEQEPPKYYSQLRVARVMAREPLVLRPVERVDRIVAYLKNSEHNGFPVVDFRDYSQKNNGANTFISPETDHKRVLCGIILRKHLNILLSDRYKSCTLMPPDAFVEVGNTIKRQTSVLRSDQEASEAVKENRVQPRTEGRLFRDISLLPGSKRSHASHAVGLAEPLVGNFKEEDVLPWSVLEGRYPRYLPVSESISEHELKSWIDLRPYTHFDPVTISDGALVSQAYRLFRSLGLRHLCAVDSNGDVTGIVTRHNLVESYVEECWHKEQRESFDYQMGWLPKPKHQRLDRSVSAL